VDQTAKLGGDAAKVLGSTRGDEPARFAPGHPVRRDDRDGLLAEHSARRFAGYAEIDSTSPSKEPAPTVVVFMPRTAQAQEVWVGLRDELSKDFRLVAVEVQVATAPGHRRGNAAIALPPCPHEQPDARGVSEDPAPIGREALSPAVVVMTSFLERRPSDMSPRPVSATRCRSSPS